MDEVHFDPLGNHEKPLLVGIYQVSIIPGVLNGGAGFCPSTVLERSCKKKRCPSKMGAPPPSTNGPSTIGQEPFFGERKAGV